MALIKPIEDNDAFEWKICRTNAQSCLCCGEPMVKGKISLLIKNAHDIDRKSEYLWVHPRCIRALSLMIKKELECERFGLERNNSQNIGCIVCKKRIRKGQIHLKLTNASDRIASKKTLWVCRKCRLDFARNLRSELRFPAKR